MDKKAVCESVGINRQFDFDDWYDHTGGVRRISKLKNDLLEVFSGKSFEPVIVEGAIFNRFFALHDFFIPMLFEDKK
jgi:hypothetical protein